MLDISKEKNWKSVTIKIYFIIDNKELESRNNGRNVFYDFLFSRIIK